MKISNNSKTQKMKGKIKNTYKFMKFLTQSKGELNEAYIDAGFFLAENEGYLKLTIHDDSSLDFVYTESDRQIELSEAVRYLELIQDRGSSQRLAGWVSDVKFKAQNDKDSELAYLIIDNKPYSSLGSFFDEELTKKKIKINKIQKSKLEELFKVLEEDDESETKHRDLDEEKTHATSNTITHAEESFKRMKQEKIEELRNDLKSAESNLRELERQKNGLESQVKAQKDKISSLKERVKSLQTEFRHNGFYFYISERVNEKIDLDKKTEKTVRKAVSKIKTIDTDSFMKLFINGEYHITIYDKDKKVVKKMNDEIIEICSSLNLLLSDDYLIYRGELEWRQIIETFEDEGFERITNKLN
jgi:hypothetical protein